MWEWRTGRREGGREGGNTRESESWHDGLGKHDGIKYKERKQDKNLQNYIKTDTQRETQGATTQRGNLTNNSKQNNPGIIE